MTGAGAADRPVDRGVVRPQVALLEGQVDLAVPTVGPDQAAARAATVRVAETGAAVVALLGAADHTVTAAGDARFEQAGTGAAVAIQRVAVVAGLAASENSIPADGDTAFSGHPAMPTRFH